MSAPRRPSDDRPELVGFERQPMVRWLSPGEIVRTGMDYVLSGAFASFSDKREIQGVTGDPQVHDFSRAEEMWVDYVADIGDGFDPTYTIADLLVRPELDVSDGGSGLTLPRGSLLVMGGDQVYPTASMENYRNHTTGPYRAALAHSERPHPALFAIPGNHDWYDGLTSFVRLFCQRGWIGGWKTMQDRSYFAIQLPHRWWLWGIDVQFDTYIDEPQLRYFREQVVPRVRHGDAIILCSAKPSWVESNEDKPESFDALDHFERTIVRASGAELRLSLTGDSHHYAHYYDAEHDAHRITAGGGGAYLSHTHRLPEDLTLPPAASRDPGKTREPSVLHLTQRYPSKATSKRLRWGVFRLPFMTPSLTATIATIYAMYGWVLQEPWRSSRDLTNANAITLSEVMVRMFRSPTSLLLSVVLGMGLVGLTKTRPPLKWIVGMVHLVAHLVAVCLIAWVTLNRLGLHGLPFLVTFAAAMAAGGGLGGSWVVAAYLLIADRFGINGNELFAAQRFEDHKHFLRMRITHDGTLEIHPVAVDRIGRRWTLRGADDPDHHRQWFRSASPASMPHLIEPTIRIRRAPANRR